MRNLTWSLLLMVLMASPAAAADPTSAFLTPPPAPHDPLHVDWAALATVPEQPPLSLASVPFVPLEADAQPLHAAAVEHSQAYMTRRRIHKLASFATLPLFGAELYLGNSIYNNPNDAKKAAHIVIGTGIVGLFGVNTVTGLWNLLGEDRQDPAGGTLRWTHAILMMVADGGFAATAMTGPNDRRFTFLDKRALHRGLAVTSIGVGTAGYLLMLLHH